MFLYKQVAVGHRNVCNRIVYAWFYNILHAFVDSFMDCKPLQPGGWGWVAAAGNSGCSRSQVRLCDQKPGQAL